MATLTDPFGGGGAPAPDLFDQWGQWLDQPGNRAAMMQTGIALMQPVGIGQTVTGHVGQALGEGGEAYGREQKFQLADEEASRKGRETDSRIEAREAAAANAETRAGATLSRAQSAASEVESRILLRQAGMREKLARVGQLEARTRLLEQQLQLNPAAAEVKNALIAAQTELAQARSGLAIEQAGVVGLDADTRARRADTSATDVESRVEERKGRLGIAQQNADTNRTRANRPRNENPLSATALFNREGRDDRDLGGFIERSAKRDADPVSGLPQYRGKTALDLLNDPAYRARVTDSFRAIRPGARLTTPSAPATTATPPATGDLRAFEGRTVTGPGGAKFIIRNGKLEPL